MALDDDLSQLEAQLEETAGDDTASTESPSRPTTTGSDADINTPTLYDAVKAKQDWGLEGERNSFLVLLLTAAGGGGMVCMTGLSRSGKDFITDCMMSMFPDQRDVYEVPNSGKEAAFYRRHNEMNMARVHRYMDIVNLDDFIEDVLKHHGTGDEASRDISVQNDDGDWVNQTFTLNVPDSIIYFLASDNEQVNLNHYPELRNRSLVISTDSSQGLSEKIQKRQGQEVALTYEPKMSQEEIMNIQEHVGSIPHDQYDVDFDTADFYNPCGEAIQANHPIPSNFVESRHDSKRLYKFINITTLWHFRDRLTAEVEDNRGNSTERMFIEPMDVWKAMRVFGEKLVMSALSLRNIDKRLLWFMREDLQPHTVSGLTQVLKQAGFNVTPTDVRSSCENLMNKNYVQKDDNAKVEYQATPFASEVDEYTTLDYDHMIKDATELVETRAESGKLDRSVADEYVNRINENVFATHPITGDTVDIREYNGFERQIKKREEELSKMLGTSVYGESVEYDEDDDTGSDEETDSSRSGGIQNFG